MSAGIVTTAILLIVGYVILSRLIGLAFRLVVPVVLLLVLAGAGVFSNLTPGQSPEDPYSYSHNRTLQESESRLADLRLGDLAGIVVDTVRSALRGTLALLDNATEHGLSQQHPPYRGPHREPHDRFGEAPPAAYDEPSQPWHP